MRRHLPGLVVAGVFFVVATVYALSRYAQLLDGAYDLGIFDQVVRAYSHLRAPIVPIKGDDYLIFGDHFHPILATLAPSYWVWDDARALLVAQAALLAASVLVVWRFALRRLRTRWVATLVAIGYAFGWAVQGMVDFDFHEVAFAVPLIAWAIDALDRRRDGELFVAAALLLLVREDMGVVVAALGAIRLVRGLVARGRSSRIWPGAVLVVAGTAAFVLVVGVVVPALNPHGTYSHWDYTGLGPDIGSSLRAMVTHPAHALHLLVTPSVKLWTLFWLLLPVAFLPLASPYTLVAVPLLLQRFLDDRPFLWTVHFHYNAPVWVVLVLAAVDGWCRLPRTLRRPAVGRPLVVVLAALPLVASLVPVASWTNQFPFGRLVTGAAFRTPAHAGDVARAVASVPAGTCVVASSSLATRLDRDHVVTLTEVSARHQDYLVLDLTAHEGDRFKLVDDVADIQPGPVYQRALEDGWTVVERSGPVVVLRAPDRWEPSAACTP